MKMNLKSLLVFAFFCFGISFSYGQSNSLLGNNSGLSKDMVKARILYENVHNVTITDAELKEKCSTTMQAHVEEWQDVLDFYANDTTTNLTMIQSVVDKMTAKLN